LKILQDFLGLRGFDLILFHLCLQFSARKFQIDSISLEKRHKHDAVS
jgi:hypothetical protein